MAVRIYLWGDKDISSTLRNLNSRLVNVNGDSSDFPKAVADHAKANLLESVGKTGNMVNYSDGQLYNGITYRRIGKTWVVEAFAASSGGFDYSRAVESGRNPQTRSYPNVFHYTDPVSNEEVFTYKTKRMYAQRYMGKAKDWAARNLRRYGTLKIARLIASRGRDSAWGVAFQL
jgi:hypothetical protein